MGLFRAQPVTDCSIEKLVDCRSNFIKVGLESKMASVQQLHDGIRIVTPVSLSAGRNEERVMLTPDGEQGRFGVAEISLELRVEF